MIAFLNGTLAGRSAHAAFVEVGGIGYQVLMSQLALSKLPEPGSEVKVLTYLQVSDSGLALYGFLREDERALFERLIGVSGVGPKVALAVLSTFSPADFAAAVAAQDVSAVQKVPGVGKKSASRIILELKGSLDHVEAGLFDDPARSVRAVSPSAEAKAAQKAPAPYKDIELALLGMGFSPAEAQLALEGAPEGASEALVLQYALRRLGGR